MDNGYTKIPNDVLDAILTHGFNYTQLMIILYVLRKTAGWNKKKDSIAVSKIARDSGKQRTYISRVVSELEEMAVLKVERPRNGVPPKISINSPKQWKPVSSSIHVSSDIHVSSSDTNLYLPRYTPVSSSIQVPVSSKIHTKDTIKDTIIKDKEKKAFPDLEEDDELDLEGWEDA